MNDMILILNNSDEYSVEIARRLRSKQLHARIVPGSIAAQEVRALDPQGVILSCDAMTDADGFDPEILALDVPVLALGRGAGRLLDAMGGACAGEAIKEKKAFVEYGKSRLFAGIAGGERFFRRALTMMLPADVQETAVAGGCTIAFEDEEKKRYGVQIELERNDPEGSAVLFNFAQEICGCSAWWSLDAALDQAENLLKIGAEAGTTAVCAVSGGVDSAVAALLARRVFGERMTAVFVDTGLMREGEVQTVREQFEAMGIPLTCVDRSGEVLEHLRCKRTAREKRAVVVDVLYESILRQSTAIPGGKTLVLGTNYSDFLHAGSSAPQWRESGMAVAEPLLELFKEEVRAIALRLDMSEEMASRKPFPALGLGARILGEITGERLYALRTAERIFREELRAAGLERKLYKHFPMIVGSEMGAGSEMIILRAVTLSGSQLLPARLPYDLVERTVARIMESLPQIVRVFYDQTPSQVGRETID